eukprot:gene31583-6779_t
MKYREQKGRGGGGDGSKTGVASQGSKRVTANADARTHSPNNSKKSKKLNSMDESNGSGGSSTGKDGSKKVAQTKKRLPGAASEVGVRKGDGGADAKGGVGTSAADVSTGANHLTHRMPKQVVEAFRKLPALWQAAVQRDGVAVDESPELEGAALLGVAKRAWSLILSYKTHPKLQQFTHRLLIPSYITDPQVVEAFRKLPAIWQAAVQKDGGAEDESPELEGAALLGVAKRAWSLILPGARAGEAKKLARAFMRHASDEHIVAVLDLSQFIDLFGQDVELWLAQEKVAAVFTAAKECVRAGDMEGAKQRYEDLLDEPSCIAAHLKLALLLKLEAASQEELGIVETHLDNLVALAIEAAQVADSDSDAEEEEDAGGAESTGAVALGTKALNKLCLLLCQEAVDGALPADMLEHMQAVDGALPADMLEHMQSALGEPPPPSGRNTGTATRLPVSLSAFGASSPFWSQHGYSQESPYFSYAHPIGKKPTSAMDQIIGYIHSLVVQRFPQAADATVAEWWAHCRPHSCGHQMHFDSDNEGMGKTLQLLSGGRTVSDLHRMEHHMPFDSDNEAPMVK